MNILANHCQLLYNLIQCAIHPPIMKRELEHMSEMHYFFKPAGVALIGASSNPNKLGYGILKNMTAYGFSGAVYPVNPGAKEILGLPCYADISFVPDPVELAVVVVQASQVPDTLISCGKRGIKAVTIISGGFKEVGEEGARLEKLCLKIAHQYNMRLIGPNCVGTIDLYSGLNTTFIRGIPERGHIGFISQSGAVCGSVVDYVADKGIGFSYFVSLGNEADVNETDLISFLADDPDTHVISAYLEAITDGNRFLETVKEVTKKKPVVILKAGHSDAGARAVSSHTGSLAGTYTAYLAAFKQAGVIIADTSQELFNISNAFANQPLPSGSRVAVITNAGGPAALASDSLSENGCSLADLLPETREELRKHVNPSAQVNNPIDMLGGATPAEYGLATALCMQDPNVDAALVIHVPTSVVDPNQIATEVSHSAKNAGKPILVCLMGDLSIRQPRLIFQGNGIPVVQFPEQTGRVLSAMAQYRQVKNAPTTMPATPYQPDKKLLQNFTKILEKSKQLGEYETRPLLEAYGIPVVPGKMATSAEEAAAAAEQIGFPVVMKIVSPDILHKSDRGGILLNLSNSRAVMDGYRQMLSQVIKAAPDARIEGVLVESMAPKGQEIIIGMRRDPQFGPLIMFGFGGIYVELFSDVAFRIAPLSVTDAEAMLNETKAGRLLKGLRGAQPADREALIETLIRLGQIAIDFPELEEMEINPLLVMQKGVLALDARAIAKTA